MFNKIRPATRRKHIVSAAILSLAGAAALSSGIARGAEPTAANEKYGDVQAAIAELRQAAGQDRRELVKKNMLLTNSEAAIFWPLYDEYRASLAEVGDRKAKLISDFLAKRDSMTQDDAEKLTKEMFSIQEDSLPPKEKYQKKMMKVLSARTVARFFQIDQKLDAVGDVVLAARIPLLH